MNIKITAGMAKHILHTATQQESGYNAAWVDGYQSLAKELGIIVWNDKREEYTIAKTKPTKKKTHEYCAPCQTKTLHINGKCDLCGQSDTIDKTGEYTLWVAGKGYVESIGHAGITYVKNRDKAFIFPDWESANHAWDILPINAVIELYE